jgi:hypothetical protein
LDLRDLLVIVEPLVGSECRVLPGQLVSQDRKEIEAMMVPLGLLVLLARKVLRVL